MHGQSPWVLAMSGDSIAGLPEYHESSKSKFLGRLN